MFDLISKEEIRKIVIGLIGDLTVKYSYYGMSIILDVNKKQSTNVVQDLYQKLIISLIYKLYIIL